ncbi:MULTISPECIES: NfeD family protein [unclassified Gemella]|uniref:NfeD family protein n=1 Tax=unclassified Gemella TaxID=2624949 RepID=UPI001D16F97E|nr:MULTISPECIES: NfeD family protein [unclassified Gemella]
MDLGNNLIYIDWFLLIAMSLSFCQQLFSKKFNFYGIISLLSLTTYVAIHVLQDGINMFVLMLFFAGLSLIILEMFIPGGIIGTLGIITVISLIIVINQQTQFITFIILSSVVAFVCLFLINIYVLNKKLLFLNRLVLSDAISTEQGYVAKESEIEILGKELVAFTDLRPSGTAIYDNVKYDVVTEGEFIDKGSKLIVKHVEGMRIIVQKI